jgi:alpha-tubulin suppressor-like RCC1 family protein
MRTISKTCTGWFGWLIILVFLAAFWPVHVGAQSAPGAQLAPLATSFTQIDGGYAHACAVTAAGALQCWGKNNAGQLGDGSSANRSAPAGVSGLTSGVSAVSAGDNHTCALLSSGAVKCWGENGSGQLGDNSFIDRSTPVSVVTLSSGISAIAAGGAHTCALTSLGAVKCWGENGFGQLGNNSTTDSSLPVTVGGLAGSAQAIAAGGSHTCALLAGGALQCWGLNSSGQLGNSSNTSSGLPQAVTGLGSGALSISAGDAHTCAHTASAAWCWGANWTGQLGDSSTTDRNAPVAVSSLSNNVSALATGDAHTCALLSGGAVQCWGYNGLGELGDGTASDRNAPVAVSGLASAAQSLAAGGPFTCALLSGEAFCWGANDFGQLGDGQPLLSAIPAQVSGLSSSAGRIAAGWGHTCALSAGGMQCWGGNWYGQLGDGSFIDRGLPTAVAGLPGAPAGLALGEDHTCALVGGGLYCWGDNQSGQLGDDYAENISPTPLAVSGLGSGVIDVTAGIDHTCALVSGGGVQCWGDNSSGQLGDGSTNGSGLPVAVSGLASGVAALAAGSAHTCALSGGQVKCWGNNFFGQLGDGSQDESSTPVDVVGLPNGITALAAGDAHTCALTAADTVKCWGWAFGDTPQDIAGLSDVNAIAAGFDHTCALLSSGAVKCWGVNHHGQLGSGSTADSLLAPVTVAGLAGGASAIAAGGNHSCALLGAGLLKCWGSDEYGQLGQGRSSMKLSPSALVESLAPFLKLNYTSAQAGSFITVSGWNFPPAAQASLLVNGRVYTAFNTTPTGSLIFFLDTTGLPDGAYAVEIRTAGGASAGAAFSLASAAPLRPQEGGGTVYALAGYSFLFLPGVYK